MQVFIISVVCFIRGFILLSLYIGLTDHITIIIQHKIIVFYPYTYTYIHTYIHTYVRMYIHRRERHDIPLIVQTCVDEVEKRGLSEVGVYRVAGVLRDVEELRQAFDTGGNTIHIIVRCHVQWSPSNLDTLGTQY